VIPVPAIDVREGRCVQLVGGDPDRERTSRPDPVAQARTWAQEGAPWLHVVDLDAALGDGDNRDVVADILGAVDAQVQVGGGIRSLEDAQRLREMGAQRVVVGTAAVRDPDFLREAADALGEALAVAVDAEDGEVLAEGWTAGTDRPVHAVAREAQEAGAGALLYTDVAREGRLEGVDAEAVADLCQAVSLPVVASGGVATVDDVRALAEAGAHACVIGSALYDGALAYADLREEFLRG
jgi:phosphoribosylformimino-5-aminoimidazole carboxamide ribotide isomerase